MTPVSTWIEGRREEQLVVGEVKVAVEAGRERVDPVDSRVSHEQGVCTVRWIVEADGILFHITVVDEAVCIRLHAIGDASLSVLNHCFFCQDLGVRAIGDQVCGLVSTC